MTNVIGFHYTLKNQDGETLDSSAGKNPLLFMTGVGQIVPALEAELVEMAVGDKKNVFVEAENGYGAVNPEMVLTVQRAQFPPEADIKPGVQFRMGNEQGAPVFTIKKIEGTDVYIDGNHPMAGVDLYFDVEVTEIREASEDELAHGHAHGPGGHHH